jgi:HD-GYP domain-containing protein (c-di-GMP phosphodiesterase class II)
MSRLQVIPSPRDVVPPPPIGADGSAPLADASAAALLRALGTFHPATASHSEAVVELARRVGKSMGVSGGPLADVELTALLHVGKIRVPRDLFDKPGPLDEDELATVRRHSVLGERLARAMPGLWHLGPAIRACHERWDGHGYPDGLAGEQIPLASRIVFVCDAYDVMTSDRGHHKAAPQGVALHELVVNAGVQFCPTSAEALVEVLSGPFRLLGARRRNAISIEHTA